MPRGGGAPVSDLPYMPWYAQERLGEVMAGGSGRDRTQRSLDAVVAGLDRRRPPQVRGRQAGASIAAWSSTSSSGRGERSAPLAGTRGRLEIAHAETAVAYDRAARTRREGWRPIGPMTAAARRRPLTRRWSTSPLTATVTVTVTVHSPCVRILGQVRTGQVRGDQARPGQATPRIAPSPAEPARSRRSSCSPLARWSDPEPDRGRSKPRFMTPWSARTVR